MRAGLSRHIGSVLLGALVSFAVRYAVADLQIAVIGIVVFTAIYVVLVFLTRAMKRPDAPTAHAAIAAVATTAAFLLGHNT